MIVWNNLTIANNSAASGVSIEPIDNNTLGTKYFQAEKFTAKSGSNSAILTATSLTVASISATNLNVSGEATINGHLVAVAALGRSQPILEGKTSALAASTKSIYIKNTSNSLSLDMSNWDVTADLITANRVAPTYLGNYNALVNIAYIKNLGSSVYKVEKAYFSAAYATTASVDTLIAKRMGNIKDTDVYLYIGQYKNDDNDMFLFMAGGQADGSQQTPYTINLKTSDKDKTCTCYFSSNSQGLGVWGNISGADPFDGKEYGDRLLHLDSMFGTEIIIKCNNNVIYTGTLTRQKFAQRFKVDTGGYAFKYSILIQNDDYMEVLLPTLVQDDNYYAMLFFTLCGNAWYHNYNRVCYASGEGTDSRSLIYGSESANNSCLPNPYKNNHITFVKASS